MNLDQILKALEAHTQSVQKQQASQYLYALNDPLEGDYLYSDDLKLLAVECDRDRENGYPGTTVVRLSDRQKMYPHSIKFIQEE
jgi:hypothetical protein